MKRKADFMIQNIGGENLLVPLGSQVKKLNGIFTLNATGAFVWELLSQERTLDELTSAVAERFDVTVEIARTDVQNFLDEIIQMGILNV